MSETNTSSTLRQISQVVLRILGQYQSASLMTLMEGCNMLSSVRPHILENDHPLRDAIEYLVNSGKIRLLSEVTDQTRGPVYQIVDNIVLKSETKFKYTACVYRCTCHIVISNTDLSEGRGNEIKLGHYAQFDHAQMAARGVGVFGSDAKIKTEQVDVVVPTISNIECWDQAYVLGHEPIQFLMMFADEEKIRAEALAKLTPLEQRLLGLNESKAARDLFTATPDQFGEAAVVGAFKTR